MKEKFYVGKEQLPVGMSTRVIVRMFTDDAKGLKDFWEKYQEARLTAGGAQREPTPLQYKVAEMKKKGMRAETIFKEQKLKNIQQVYSIINRVAMWEYLNS